MMRGSLLDISERRPAGYAFPIVKIEEVPKKAAEVVYQLAALLNEAADKKAGEGDYGAEESAAEFRTLAASASDLFTYFALSKGGSWHKDFPYGEIKRQMVDKELAARLSGFLFFNEYAEVFGKGFSRIVDYNLDLESINNPNIDIIAHRGHSFHLTMDTFTRHISSNANKLLYLGSCGSFGSVSELQKQFPNAYFISDEDTGRGSDNHRILLGIMRNMAQGERNWDTIKQNTYQRITGEPRGIIWPNEKSLLLYNFIQKLTGTSMDVLLKDRYGYIPEELFPVPDRCTIQTVPFGETIS